jgi:hypothetical protein
MFGRCPRGVGQSVKECVVKPLGDVKVTGSKLAVTNNPTMLRVGVACQQVPHKLTNKKKMFGRCFYCRYLIHSTK